MTESYVDAVARGEFSATIEGLKTEMKNLSDAQGVTRAELNAKLDTLIGDKTAQAFNQGRLQERLDSFERELKSQSSDISSLKRQMDSKEKELQVVKDGPKNVILGILGDVIKGLLIGGGGFLLGHYKF
jgi:flagellar capping protein FliD